MDHELLVVVVRVVLVVVAEATAEHLVENEDGDPGQEQGWHMHHINNDEWYGESDLSWVIVILKLLGLGGDHGAQDTQVDPLDDPLKRSPW